MTEETKMKMKVVGKDLGNVTCASEKPYRFMVLDPDDKPVSNIELVAVFPGKQFKVEPQHIITDEFGIGECKVTVDANATGTHTIRFVTV